jgi:hypothetical protein
MTSARLHRSPLPAARAWFDERGGFAAVADALLSARGRGAEELEEARELLAYWERRARRLPRWALMRRREAREMAGRWRERVRAAEERRYGRGLLGAASMYALERRAPTTLAHRGRRAARVVVYAVAGVAVTFTVPFLAAAVAIAEAVFSVL